MKLADRVKQAGLEHPEAFARVRAACGEQSSAVIDLNDHASLIVLDVQERRAAFARRRKGPLVALSAEDARRFGYEDGLAGTFDNSGRCGVEYRVDYDRGHRDGEKAKS